jgi:integrase/predicted transcriptional regulator
VTKISAVVPDDIAAALKERAHAGDRSVAVIRRAIAEHVRRPARSKDAATDASAFRYGGSFPTKREATMRMQWVAGELAALPVPDLITLVDPMQAPTLAEAARRWQASRVDVSEATKLQHRTALRKALPTLGMRRIDTITAQDIADLVGRLHSEEQAKRESIRKVVNAVAMVFDHARVTPNPARDKTTVNPREEPEDMNPPCADDILTVYRLLPSKHRLPLLFLDWSGVRVAAIDKTLVGDYDASRQRVLLRSATTKTRKPLWIDLHPTLAEAIEATLPPREDRDSSARLFGDSGSDALRTAIGRACRAAGIPAWSPHDLRHRRISLLHLRGVPWARIAEMVGQRNLAVTANTYSHVLMDESEVEYAPLLANS